MNPKENKNECLGEIICGGCKGVAYIYKNKKGLLYSRCGDCGCDQRTGATMQARFAQYVPIGTAKQAEAAAVVEPEPEAKPEAEAEAAKPEAAAVAENEPEAKPKQKRGLLVAGVAAIAAVAVAVLN